MVGTGGCQWLARAAANGWHSQLSMVLTYPCQLVIITPAWFENDCGVRECAEVACQHLDPSMDHRKDYAVF